MNPTGIKNRFWEKLVRVSPPFDGSEAEARHNIASHKWHSVNLYQRYTEAHENWAHVKECRLCGVIADSARSRYACGAAPDGLRLDEWLSK